MKQQLHLSFFLLVFFFLCISVSQAQVRYLDAVFNEIKETPNVRFSIAASQPKPSPQVTTSNGVVIPANFNVPEHDLITKDLYMDIYEPKGDLVEDRPLLIFCSGGGFANVNKKAGDMVTMANAMTKKGYVTAVMEYRTGINALDEGASGRAIFRAMQDSRTAIRFFRASAAMNNPYKIASDKIYIIGYSAGAFIALHNVYLDREAERPLSTMATTYNYSATGDSNITNYAIPDLGCLDCVGDHKTYSGKANGAIAFAGAIGNLDYIEGATDVPVQLFHSSDDTTVPHSVGMPYENTPTRLPNVYGSCVIGDDAQEKNAPVILKKYNDRAHRVHTTNGTDLYPEIIPEISNFLFSILENPNGETLAFDNFGTKKTFQAYPNPIRLNQMLHLSTGSTDPRTLSIINPLGSILYQQTISGKEVAIPMAILKIKNSGLFFIKISSTYDSYTTRLLVH